MARQLRWARGFVQVFSSTGLQPFNLEFMSTGETLTRIRWSLRAFYDPPLITATTAILTSGWAWGFWIDPSAFPAHQLDPVNDANSSWIWHEWGIAAYDVLGGNNYVYSPPGESVRDTRAQRLAASPGEWIHFSVKDVAGSGDGWSFELGYAMGILMP